MLPTAFRRSSVVLASIRPGSSSRSANAISIGFRLGFEPGFADLAICGPVEDPRRGRTITVPGGHACLGATVAARCPYPVARPRRA